MQAASAIHVTSNLEAAELARFHWQLPRIVTISNGVDDPQSAAGEGALVSEIHEFAGGEPLALFLGRLSWKKGLDRLLRAFALTRQGKLVVAGTDDENLLPGLRELAQGLGIADRVKILPRTIVGTEKERLFAAARVFVLPSYSENLGNTVLEALRRGVPAIVTPEVGAAEIVRDAGGGLVVEGEPTPLAEAIGRLMNEPEHARSMGADGRRHVMEHYGWNSVGAQMEALYRSISRNG